jgi:hypothetical protein
MNTDPAPNQKFREEQKHHRPVGYRDIFRALAIRGWTDSAPLRRAAYHVMLHETKLRPDNINSFCLNAIELYKSEKDDKLKVDLLKQLEIRLIKFLSVHPCGDLSSFMHGLLSAPSGAQLNPDLLHFALDLALHPLATADATDAFAAGVVYLRQNYRRALTPLAAKATLGVLKKVGSMTEAYPLLINAVYTDIICNFLNSEIPATRPKKAGTVHPHHANIQRNHEIHISLIQDIYKEIEDQTNNIFYHCENGSTPFSIGELFSTWTMKTFTKWGTGKNKGEVSSVAASTCLSRRPPAQAIGECAFPGRNAEQI